MSWNRFKNFLPYPTFTYFDSCEKPSGSSVELKEKGRKKAENTGIRRIMRSEELWDLEWD